MERIVATAVFLTRSAESTTQVTYRYGPHRDDQPETVSILKETGETTGTTARAGWVGGWIRLQHERTGPWLSRASPFRGT